MGRSRGRRRPAVYGQDRPVLSGARRLAAAALAVALAFALGTLVGWLRDRSWPWSPAATASPPPGTDLTGLGLRAPRYAVADPVTVDGLRVTDEVSIEQLDGDLVVESPCLETTYRARVDSSGALVMGPPIAQFGKECSQAQLELSQWFQGRMQQGVQVQAQGDRLLLAWTVPRPGRLLLVPDGGAAR